MEEESSRAASTAEGPCNPGPKIDTTVGTIVWVRRRNGSWWPGRILGTDELSETHLMSPRSGTPVKLLGREDASVDWYNIDKSKRVKAFRCGEYDDCIERAKAYANLPAKKVVKYARREDAILHALELEKKQLMQKQQSSGVETVSSDEKKHGSRARQSQIHVLGPHKDKSEDNCCVLEHDSAVDASQSVVSFQQTNLINAAGPVHVQKVKQEPDMEEDSIEGTTRMRGLQDFGLKIVPKKKQHHMPTTCEGIPQVILPENIVRSPSYIGRSIGCGSSLNSSKGSSLTFKKKRSEMGTAQESFVKRRDRRRPITKVLESSAKLPVSSLSDYNHSVTESVYKGSMENEVGDLQLKQVKQSSLSAPPRNNSDYRGISLEKEITLRTDAHVYETINGEFHSVSLVTDNACSNLSEHMDVNYYDKSYLNPEYHMEENALSDVILLSSPVSKRFRSAIGGRQPVHPIEGQLSISSKEGLDETGFSSYLCQSDSVEQSMGGVANQRVSKWQSKGKRNARTLNKKHGESSNGRSVVETVDICTASIHGMSFENKVSLTKELGTKRIIGNSYDKLVPYEKQNQELNGFFFPDVFLQDGCRQRDNTISNHGRVSRVGISVPTFKADVQGLHHSATIEQYILEGTAGSFSNDNSQGMSPPEEKSTIPESSPSDDKVSRTKWLAQTDTQDVWQQKMFIEGLDSGTSSAIIFEEPKSVGETQFKVSNAVKIPKIGIPAANLNETMLYDVPLEVRTTYQGEHVPLVSLMSRLNGKAIVGHPVTVETLEDGECDAYIVDDSYLDEAIANSETYGTGELGKNTVQPPWRTARRSEIQRVPRSCSFRKGNVNYNVCQPSGSQNGRPVIKASYGLNDKTRYIRKNSLLKRHPSLDKKSSKKLMRGIGLSSKKTRTLSSLADHELKYLNGESQPLKLAEAPLVTCIPLKLVFSRIKEAVGNSSKAGCGLSSSGSRDDRIQ